MEERYPEVKDLATQSGVWEMELRLQREIETVRKEIVEAEGRLAKEIETIRKEVETVCKETVEAEGRLTKEIEQVRVSALRWLVSLLVGQTAVILASLFALIGK
jgi:predicted regulator of amino acid metabolism with ACT domain